MCSNQLDRLYVFEFLETKWNYWEAGANLSNLITDFQKICWSAAYF